MDTTPHPPGPLEVTFTETLRKNPGTGGWTCVVWPASPEYFGTHGRVKVRGTIDGESFETSFMALGDGNHMLPVKTAIRDRIGKAVGEPVEVRLTERLA